MAEWEDGTRQALAGTDLAGGQFAVLCVIKGDLVDFAKVLKLRHYNAKALCDFCPALNDDTDPALACNNYGPGCAWQNRCFSREEWRSLYKDKFLHPIFNDLEHMSQHNVEADELHVMFLGTVQYLLGSILWLLVCRLLPGAKQEAMGTLWSFIVVCYSDLNVRNQFSKINISSFIDPKKINTEYPRLKGKGMECRDLVLPMLHAWRDMAPPDYPQYELVLNTLELQLAIQRTLWDHDHQAFLPVDVAKNLKGHVCEFLTTYSKLAVAADAGKDLLWNMPSKFHWLWHLGDKAQFLNPQLGCCLIDEYFVGKIKTIAHSCASGTPATLVPLSVVDKHRWAMNWLEQ